MWSEIEEIERQIKSNVILIKFPVEENENRKRETIFKEIEDESFSYFMKDVTP